MSMNANEELIMRRCDFESADDYARYVIGSGGPEPGDGLEWARFGSGEYIELFRAIYLGTDEEE